MPFTMTIMFIVCEQRNIMIKIIGTGLFYILTPLWFILSLIWWKKNSAFVLVNILYMFQDPFNIK